MQRNHHSAMDPLQCSRPTTVQGTHYSVVNPLQCNGPTTYIAKDPLQCNGPTAGCSTVQWTHCSALNPLLPTTEQLTHYSAVALLQCNLPITVQRTHYSAMDPLHYSELQTDSAYNRAHPEPVTSPHLTSQTNKPHLGIAAGWGDIPEAASSSSPLQSQSQVILLITDTRHLRHPSLTE